MSAKKKQRQKTQESLRRKLPALAGLATALAIVLLGWWWSASRESSFSGSKEFTKVGVYQRRETKPTLTPVLFAGKAARAYQVAQEIPDVLDRLECYCGCDKHAGHVSLLSCYTDDHGAT